jgi:predicted GIY-YIG superfamily endonuclease
VLSCEQGCHYVGKTNRPLQSRIEEHFNRNGSEWTQKYKPLKVVEQIKNADAFDEDKYTKMYMKKYGIDKVRGGTYSEVILPQYKLMALEKELYSASNTCFRCNRPGHFASQCYATTKIVETPIVNDCWRCVYCDKEFTTAELFQINLI